VIPAPHQHGTPLTRANTYAYTHSKIATGAQQHLWGTAAVKKNKPDINGVCTIGKKALPTVRSSSISRLPYVYSSTQQCKDGQDIRRAPGSQRASRTSVQSAKTDKPSCCTQTGRSPDSR
ncbi:unnamed protein product, partial [Pylaiella littoralis]